MGQASCGKGTLQAPACDILIPKKCTSVAIPTEVELHVYGVTMYQVIGEINDNNMSY